MRSQISAMVVLALGSLLASPALSARRDADGATSEKRAPTPKQSAKAADFRLFDGFEGKLALDWKPVRHDPTHVSLTKREGMLTLTTQAGDVYAAMNSAKNLYLVDAPFPQGGDFVATTCLDSFQPTVPWQQAGLLVYEDDDNFVKLCFEFSHVGHRILDFTREEDGRPLARRIPFDPDSPRVWLRLTKRGKFYEIASSPGGEAFSVHGEFVWGDGLARQIGLMAVGGADVPERDAHFDFFEIRPLIPQEENEPRLEERRRLQGVWEAVSCRFSGKPMTKAPLSRFTFTPDKVTVSEKEGTLDAEYTLDVTCDPKQLSLWKEVERSTAVLRFVYQLERDTLVVCFNPRPDGPAPTGLETQEGDGLMLATLRRVTDR